MRYRQLRIIAAEQFQDSLRGLALDERGRILAVGDSAVKLFAPDGKLIREWATASPPFSVAVAAGGAIYVGETGQVEIFTSDGQLTGTWRDPERLGQITAIGFAQGSVLVADSRARTIRRFDAAQQFLNDIGADNRMHGFLIPNGALDLSVDADGIIHAANPGKHRVERYSPDGRLLGHIGRFDGLDPEGFAGCCNPTNVHVGHGGLVYVTEKAGPRAKVLDREGKLVAVIATDAFDPACKNMDIVADPRGPVYVADTARRHIVVFAPEKEGAPS